MPSDFAASLTRYLDVYQHASLELSAFLEQTFDSYRIEELKQTDRASLHSVEAKILEKGDSIKSILAEVRSQFPEFNQVEDDFDLDEFCRLEAAQSLLEDWSRRFGLSGIDEAIPHFIDAVRRDNAAWVPKPDYHLHFGRQFAASVDGLVERITGLEDLEYKDILWSGARELLRQAHQCYLYGLDSAVAILCGAVLEETLRRELKLDKWKLEQLLEEARGSHLLTWEEWGMGDLVRELRNDALHNHSRFSRRPPNELAVLLSSTRAILRVLLTPKVSE